MSGQQQMPAVPTICPGCGKELDAVQPDRSTHFVCPGCGSYFVDEWEEEKAVLTRFGNELHQDMVLKPGASGKLFAKRYVVAGAMRKIERNDPSVAWMEYILYGESDTSAVLVEFDGEWLFVKPAGEIPQKSGRDNLTYKKGTYEPYHDYNFDIIGAAGSFDYNVLDDQILYTWEYSNATHRLIYETRGGTDGDWYIGMPVDGSMIADGFGIPASSLAKKKKPLSERSESGPNPLSTQLQRMYLIAFIAIVAVGLLQLGINYFHPSADILKKQYVIGETLAGTTGKPLATETFKVQSRSSLSVLLQAPVSNSWVEVNAVMVNDKTGQTFESGKSIEEYHGYEDGESWSEGGTGSEIQFSSVPPGSYHLNVTTTADQSTMNPGMPLNVRVRHGSWVLSNFVLILVVILAFPIITHMVSNNKNTKR